jgi:hypothetical protein
MALQTSRHNGSRAPRSGGRFAPKTGPLGQAVGADGSAIHNADA